MRAGTQKCHRLECRSLYSLLLWYAPIHTAAINTCASNMATYEQKAKAVYPERRRMLRALDSELDFPTLCILLRRIHNAEATDCTDAWKEAVEPLTRAKGDRRLRREHERDGSGSELRHHFDARPHSILQPINAESTAGTQSTFPTWRPLTSGTLTAADSSLITPI